MDGRTLARGDRGKRRGAARRVRRRDAGAILRRALDGAARLDPRRDHARRRAARRRKQPALERALGSRSAAAQPRDGRQLHAARRRAPEGEPGARRRERAPRPPAAARRRRLARHGRGRTYGLMVSRRGGALGSDGYRGAAARRADRGFERGRTAADPHRPRHPARQGDRVADRRRGQVEAFAAALGGGPEDEMPIRAVLRRASDRLTVFSAHRS